MSKTTTAPAVLTLEEVTSICEMLNSEDKSLVQVGVQLVKNAINKANTIPLLFIFKYGDYILGDWKDDCKELEKFIEPILKSENISDDLEYSSLQMLKFLETKGTPEDILYVKTTVEQELNEICKDILNMPSWCKIELNISKDKLPA